MNEIASRSRNTRIALLQALMATSLGEIDLESTKQWLENSGYLQEVDQKKFNRTLLQVSENLEELDVLYAPLLQTRSIEELGQSERTVLRIACHEITNTSIPVAVVINEWVEIAKEFGAESSYRFVNGVLDKLAKQTRLDSTEGD